MEKKKIKGKNPEHHFKPKHLLLNLTGRHHWHLFVITDFLLVLVLPLTYLLLFHDLDLHLDFRFDDLLDHRCSNYQTEAFYSVYYTLRICGVVYI